MAAETVATIDSGDDDLDIHSTSIESLPPEIRVQTYDHLFASMRPPPIADDLEAPSDWLEDPVLGSFIWRDTPPPVSKTCDVFPGLTRASARIRNEATPQYREHLRGAIGDFERLIKKRIYWSPKTFSPTVYNIKLVNDPRGPRLRMDTVLQSAQRTAQRADSVLRALRVVPWKFRRRVARRRAMHTGLPMYGRSALGSRFPSERRV